MQPPGRHLATIALTAVILAGTIAQPSAGELPTRGGPSPAAASTPSPPTGTVTTFTDAEIIHPSSLVEGPDGNLWFTNADHSIGRMTPEGTLTRFADPTISIPQSIAVAPDGYLWFANKGNGSIGRISTDGVVTNITGPNLDPTGLTVDGDGTVWFTNETQHTISRIVGGSDIVTFPSGDRHPTKIVTGPDGTVWWLNRGLCRHLGSGAFTCDEPASIEHRHDDGTIEMVAATGSPAAFDHPEDFVVGPDDTVWLLHGPSAWETRAIGKLTGGVFTLTGGYASSIGLGPDGNLWYGIDDGTIGRVSAGGDDASFTDDQIDRPMAFTPGPDGKVWYLNQGCGPYGGCGGDGGRPASVGEITLEGVVDAHVDGATVAAPQELAAGPDGNLWFTNHNPGSIGRMTPSGEVSRFPVPSATTPSDITAGPDGAMWFTDWTNSRVGRISTEGAITVFEDPLIAEPDQIITGPDGNLWFINYNWSLARMTPDGEVTTFSGGSLDYPRGLTSGPDGNLWVTSDSAISKVTPAGTVTEMVPPGIIDDMWTLESIATGPDGNLWTSSSYPEGQIYRITTAGEVAPMGHLGGALTSGPDGQLWFTDLETAWQHGFQPQYATLGRLEPSGSPFTTFPVGAFPNDIAAGADGGIWFTMPSIDTIGRIQPSLPSPFSDVPVDHPFIDAIAWLKDEGIGGGFPDGTFRPGTVVTRQAMAAFVYRYAGSPDGEDPICVSAPFSDVSTSNPFCGEIAWMDAAGISTGFPDGTFRPAATISRQALSAFIYRLADSPDGPDPSCPAAPFSDVPTSHPFCGEIAWMSDTGVSTGYDDGTYRPTIDVTRQAMAAFLHRYDGLAL